MVLRRMNIEGATVHGFRSSFRDWAGNVSSFPREITGNGAGACRRRQGWASLSAKRCAGKAPQVDGSKGRILRTEDRNQRCTYTQTEVPLNGPARPVRCPLRSRLCCKSLFASLNTNFPGRTRGNRTIIWGATLSSDEFAGVFGNGLEATSFGDCGLFGLFPGNWSHGILGVLQHYPSRQQTRGGGDVRDQTKQGQPPRAHFELGVLLLALPCGLPIQHRLLANHTAGCLFVARGEAFLHADLIGAIYTSGISLSNCEKRNLLTAAWKAPYWLEEVRYPSRW